MIDSINVNVEEVATYLCHIFKEPSTGKNNKKGYYKNLYNTQGCRTADFWLGTLIETALFGTATTPGRYFYKHCVEIHRDGLSSQTQQLVERVRQIGPLTYKQLLEALRQPVPASQTSSAAAPAVSRSTPLPRQPLSLRISCDRTISGMSWEDLEKVKSLINSDQRTACLLTRPCHQHDGSYALLIDDRIGHQAWVYSLSAWQLLQATIRVTRDLFPR